MVGYTILCLIAFSAIAVGLTIVGLSFKHWRLEDAKKKNPTNELPK